MTKHFQKEIDRVKEAVQLLAAKVEERVSSAVKAVQSGDIELANLIVAGDDEIDAQEVEIEEECLKILALHQPVATDLRLLVAVLKLTNDLERIGDLAVSIANRVEAIAAMTGYAMPEDVEILAAKVKSLLRLSLEALVNLDLAKAKQAMVSDREIDAFHRSIHLALAQEMKKTPAKLDGLLSVLSVARNLERIADHATNIAEDVIYMVQGEIVRHRGAW